VGADDLWAGHSPLAGELAALPNAWEGYPSAEHLRERPYGELPEWELVAEWAKRCGGPVLDLACGTGRWSLALAGAGYEVVGLDLNPGFIEAARAEAARRSPQVQARLRFEVGDARRFGLPERFGLVLMMDQSFKYLLRHQDHLDCLHCVREHLREDGRFLVEHRCQLRLPEAGEGEPYTFSWDGREWVGVDSYDAIQQVGLSAFQPAGDPEAEPRLEPCRDFTYQELELLHVVVGLTPERIIHDLAVRGPDATYFDAAFILKKSAPWRPRAD
jgi:SAM-dependent methyltransferase